MKNLYNKSSRYYNQETVVNINKNAESVSALKLRILPNITGNDFVVKDTIRLDIIAYQQYNNSTKFWHIADANTALEVVNLTKIIKNGTKIIKIPLE